jgi:hypothetical protein
VLGLPQAAELFATQQKALTDDIKRLELTIKDIKSKDVDRAERGSVSRIGGYRAHTRCVVQRLHNGCTTATAAAAAQVDRWRCAATVC